ncbi:hypothetical protein DLD77_04875 [Chitinophaga alhagiae]|uniref:DUF3108 domain-containing protein n=1 Tax=Chitinophaga alhagiae TaxID=2203219 RepID=A0ABM6WB41_9BACT|nr:DUF6134 family protein [Chitinophaga alhagiae]AWO01079.1 hypothetical protein DLD77_04875 [Chitinophaga alhagiae]
MHITRKPYQLKRILFILILPFLAATEAAGQSHTFEILFGNNAVGLLDVKQEPAGASRRITIRSRVQSKLLSRMETDIEVVYQHNVLHRARVTRIQARPNDDNRETLTEKADRGYNVTRKGVRAPFPVPQIIFCVSDLYFTEPKEVKEVYSETLGRFLPIKRLADGRYALGLPEGRQNFYTYSKGRLAQVEVNHSLGRAVFRLLEKK